MIQNDYLSKFYIFYMRCYICHEPAKWRQPCVCGAYVHPACLKAYWEHAPHKINRCTICENEFKRVHPYNIVFWSFVVFVYLRNLTASLVSGYVIATYLSRFNIDNE